MCGPADLRPFHLPYPRPAPSCSLCAYSEDQALENPLYIDMILDILSERGFSVNVDSKIIERPVRVDFSTLQVINEMYGLAKGGTMGPPFALPLPASVAFPKERHIGPVRRTTLLPSPARDPTHSRPFAAFARFDASTTENTRTFSRSRSRARRCAATGFTSALPPPAAPNAMHVSLRPLLDRSVS